LIQPIYIKEFVMENSKFKKVMLAAAITVVSTNAPASEQNSELSLGKLANIYEQVSGEEFIVARRGLKKKRKKIKIKIKTRSRIGMVENSDKGFLV